MSYDDKKIKTNRLIIKRTKKEDADFCLLPSRICYRNDKTLIDFCHVNGGKKITAPVVQENIGSNAVLKKLNFYIEKEGTFKKCGTDIIYDEYTYRLDLDK